MKILLTGSRDLLDEGGISQCYLSIKPLQCGVGHLQAAVSALQLQSVHVIHSVSMICNVAGSSFLILQNIFAGQKGVKRNARCSKSPLKCILKCRKKKLETIPNCLPSTML